LVNARYGSHAGPSISSLPGTAWRDDDEVPSVVTVDGVDVGVATINVFDGLPGATLIQSEQLCATAAPCPVEQTIELDYLPEGRRNLTVNAYDIGGFSSAPTTWVSRVDGTDPIVAVGGALKQAEGQALTSSSYALDISATDGDDSSAATERSGVASIEILVDGIRTFFEEQSCSAGSCPMDASWTYQVGSFAPGPHVVSVVVRDQLGHEATEEITVGAVVGDESTTFEMANEVELADVTEELEDSDLIVEAIDDPQGGYVAENGVPADIAAEEYREEYSYLVALDAAVAATPEEELDEIPEVGEPPMINPPVTAVTVAGDPPTSELGSLADDVALRSEAPEIPESAADHTELQPVTMAGGGYPSWVPSRRKLLIGNRPRPDTGTIVQTLQWNGAGQIDDFNGFAYEHDLKFHNRRNSDRKRGSFPSGDFCERSEHNNFYLHRPEYSVGFDRYGYGARGTWHTTLPDPYLDTKLSDPCTQEDMTIGVYHTNQLNHYRRYRIGMVWNRGDRKRSPISAGFGKLSKECSSSTGQGSYCGEFDCPGQRYANGAFCTGLINAPNQNLPFIRFQRPIIRAPLCFEWQKSNNDVDGC